MDTIAWDTLRRTEETNGYNGRDGSYLGHGTAREVGHKVLLLLFVALLRHCAGALKTHYYRERGQGGGGRGAQWRLRTDCFFLLRIASLDCPFSLVVLRRQ